MALQTGKLDCIIRSEIYIHFCKIFCVDVALFYVCRSSLYSYSQLQRTFAAMNKRGPRNMVQFSITFNKHTLTHTQTAFRAKCWNSVDANEICIHFYNLRDTMLHIKKKRRVSQLRCLCQYFVCEENRKWCSMYICSRR